MKYISEKEIIRAWSNLIDSDDKNKTALNKFFGILEILKLIKLEQNGVITPNVQYQISNSQLSESLQSTFYFGDTKREFTSAEVYYVIFPNFWQKNILQSFLKNKPISNVDAAILCLQNEEFPDNIENQKLLSRFKNKYNIGANEDVLFEDDSHEVEYQEKPPNRKKIFSELKKHIKASDETKHTVAFDKNLISANPGELARGPFIQPLYSATENLKCILLAAFDLSEQYQISSSKTFIPTLDKENMYPLNQILYGPPGTGKTYNAVCHALVAIKNYNLTDLLEKQKTSKGFREQLKKEFDVLVDEGQIQFVTFHQSYSYEEFIEGIKPTVNGEDVEYNIEDGVFKRLCLMANGHNIGSNFDDIYNSFITDVTESGNELALKSLSQGKPFTVKINKNGSCVAIPKTDDASEMTVTKKEVKKFIETGVADYWKTYISAIADYITKKYKVERKTEDNTNKKYVLIIDEINRGNISKIFGELITLIEDTKRIGQAEELKIKLTYSGTDGGDMFGVPSNLYIIGTMNTADRSIALLDTALRRRFTFYGYTAESELLNGNVEGVNVRSFLEAINKRIEFLLDKDHLIGHAFLLNINSKVELVNVFKNKIYPLIEEYFYGDYEKIQLVLGDNKDWGKPENLKCIRAKSLADQKQIFGTNSIDGYEDKVVYELNSELFNAEPKNVPIGFFNSIYSQSFKEN